MHTRTMARGPISKVLAPRSILHTDMYMYIVKCEVTLFPASLLKPGGFVRQYIYIYAHMPFPFHEHKCLVTIQHVIAGY